MKQDIKLVAIDMDGTLLNSDKRMSSHTRETLETAIGQGIYIVPATGRTHLGLPEDLEAVKGLRYGIFCNGAVVYDMQKEEVIYSDYMEVPVILELLRFAEQYDVMCDVYIKGYGRCERKCLDNLAYYNIDPNLVSLVQKTRRPVDNLIEYVKTADGAIEKMNVFFHDFDERNRAMEAFKKLDICNVSSSLYNNIELNHRSCSKGKALVHLGEILGLKPENIMACGDASNDFEMIQAAGLGVAMGNAMEEIKDSADYITASNDEDGVALVIEKFVL